MAHRLFSSALMLLAALSLTPTPSEAQGPAAPEAPTSAARNPVSTAEAAVAAARSGNVSEMERLRGSDITLQGRTQSVLRDTKAYRDVLVLTGPEFKIAGGLSGFEFILRIPRSVKPDELPDLIDATGSLSDFEPRRDGEGLQWMPVITIDFLK